MLFKSKKPLELSVIVPVYNVAPYLTECLDSIGAAIRHMDAEVILVDDGSTDGSREMARAYAESHPEFIASPIEHKGVSAARNHGARLARGTWLIFADSDDLIPEYAYRSMVDLGRQHQADMVVCRTAKFDETGVHGIPFLERIFFGLTEVCTDLSRNHGFLYDILATDKMILRSFYEEHHFHFPEATFFEDKLWSLQLYLACRRVAVMTRTGYLWRLRPGSTTTQVNDPAFFKNKIDQLAVLCDLFFAGPRDPVLVRSFQMRLLLYDLAVIFRSSVLKDNPEALNFLRVTKEFMDRYVDRSLLAELRPILQAKYAAAEALDLDRVLKLIDFHEAFYNTMPVTRQNGTYLISLPEELFPEGRYSAMAEYAGLEPRVRITGAKEKDKHLVLTGRLHFRRFSVSDPSEQHIQAFLLDEMADRRIPLPSKGTTAVRFSESKGKEICAYTGEEIRYDYSGAGFQITLDPEILETAAGSNWFSIQLDFRHPLMTSSVYLRGAGPKAQWLQGLKFETEKGRGCIGFDTREQFYIRFEQK